MTRMERAHRIKDRVLELAAQSPHYEYTNSGRALVVDGDGWEARIHMIFNLPPGRPWSPRPVELLPGYTLSPCLPNRMSIWLNPGPKVFTVEWLDEKFRLVTFRRGDWEEDCFGLPPYQGSAGFQPYELYTRRSRRW